MCIVLVMLHMYVKISEFWVQNLFCCLCITRHLFAALFCLVHDVNSTVLRILCNNYKLGALHATLHILQKCALLKLGHRFPCVNVVWIFGQYLKYLRSLKYFSIVFFRVITLTGEKNPTYQKRAVYLWGKGDQL